MRQAKIYVQKQLSGILEEVSVNHYRFSYIENYNGPPISLTMPTSQRIYDFKQFPPFFEGLLPEGNMLDAMLRKYKLDRTDLFGQLLKVGEDVVGAVTIEEYK